jgi:O-antigen ligase
MNFEFPLIENILAHQFKMIRYVSDKAFLSILFMVSIVVFQKIEYVFVIGLLLAGIYVYTQRTIVIGRLSIDFAQMEVTKELKEFIFPFNKVSNLVFERGATWHLQYQNSINEYDRRKLIQFDNWVKFNFEGQDYVFEFEINSIQSNERFETMISELHRRNIQFHFLSI